MELNLTCDYRAIDSAGAANFLKIIKKNLESLKINELDPDWLKGNEQLRLI
jgi:pyruvate/2-oxoglutarate dehydrogenase complex dihydrolipoamide acyltransferase (E2) component